MPKRREFRELEAKVQVIRKNIDAIKEKRERHPDKNKYDFQLKEAKKALKRHLTMAQTNIYGIEPLK